MKFARRQMTGSHRGHPNPRAGGFSLMELLVASAVLIMLLALVLSIVSQTSSVWRSSSQKIAAFQGARAGFERVIRQLSQATLNTYWAYDNPNQPMNYVRQSELHFRTGPKLLGTPSHAVFFQAPASRTADQSTFGGLERLLNGCGFFIDYVSDEVPSSLQSRLNSRSRFRLMQWIQNTENLAVYDPSTGQEAWFQNARQEALPIADNVIALILWPKLADEDSTQGWVDSYEYDSRAGSLASQPIKMNQLPPIVNVVMVAIDSASADRMGNSLKAEIDACTSGLFESINSGNPRKSIQDDLAQLESRLKAKHIDYRVFESAVPLREARWSKK